MPNFTRPQPPVFERVEGERLHRKQRFAAAFGYLLVLALTKEQQATSLLEIQSF